MKLNNKGDFHIVGLNNTPQSQDGPRINDMIRADSVRCIGADAVSYTHLTLPTMIGV